MDDHLRGAAIIVGGGALRVTALTRQMKEPGSQGTVGISATLIQRPGVVCADSFGHRGDPLPIQSGIGTGEAQQDLGDPVVVCADSFGHRGDPLPIQSGIGTGEAQQDLGDPVFGFQDVHTAVTDPHPHLTHRRRVVTVDPDVDGVVEFLDR
nr:hypothetical protein [Mycolicibacterium murale]